MKRRHSRDPEERRRVLITLAERALEEQAKDDGDEAPSRLLEDGLREFREKMRYLADNLAADRGYFQERATLRYILDWLRRLPKEDAYERGYAKIAAILSRAWKRKLISRADEGDMPILTRMEAHVRSVMNDTWAWGPKSIGARSHTRRQILENGFHIWSSRSRSFGERTPALVRLAYRVADTARDEAESSRRYI